VSDNGALRIEASSPFIDHNIIQDNQDDGIHIWSASAPHITDNSIITSSGDGIHANDSAVTISGNTTTRNAGYGIYVHYGFSSQSRTAAISDNTVTRNTGYGIHVYYDHWNDNNVATISDNTVTNNIGPGISVYYNLWNDNNTAIVSGNTITGNSASNGGGIHVDYSSDNDNTTVTISNNTITGNSASNGGGIYIIHGNPIIQNNTIVSNTATQVNRGGGIYLCNGYRPTINDNNLYANMTGDPANIPNDLYNGNTYTGVAVNAENNYWGTTDPAVIEDHIWHFMDDPSLDPVDYVPYTTGGPPPPPPPPPCEVSGLINTDTTWSPSACDPYIVTGNLSVRPGVMLTIEPGTTVKFNSPKVLAVAGTLVARGTAESLITFTSNQSSLAAGDWGYIHFADSSTDATFDGDGNYTGGSIIQYAVIEYAGGASVSDNGALRIEASSPFIDHNIIQDNQDDGIHIWSASAPHITGNNITTSSGDGIHANDSDVTISGNTTARNAGYGIHVRYGFHNQSRTAAISNNTVTRNTGYGIHVYYDHWNDNNVATISDNTVTNNIGPGISVYYNLWDDNNTAKVSGNTITGNSASNGGGIHVDYSYNDNITVTISCNTITGNSASNGGGIYIIHGNPIIQNNTIISNTATQVNRGGGIYLCDGCRPTINDNNLYANMTGDPANIPNNLYNGNTYTGVAVNAENNYWGTTDPAVIEDHIWHFMDDPSLDLVGYEPFRDSPVPPCTTAPAIEVTISGPTTGITNTAYTFTATVSPFTAAQPITYAWQATGQPPVTHTDGLSDTVIFTWPTSGTRTITVTATNAEETATDTHVITIGRPVPVERVTISGPTTGTAGMPYTFNASASPLTATRPITYVWQATGQSEVVHAGGLSDRATFTWTTAGTQVITVTASNAWGSARASHTIAIPPPPTDGDAYEPDDTCAQASTLTTDGTVQQHTFHDYADADWVRFTVVSGTTYIIQAASTGPLADTEVELHDSCAAPPLPVGDLDLGPGTRLVWTAPQAGTYYLRIANYDPENFGPLASYDLHIRAGLGVGAAIVVAGRNNGGTLRSNINSAANRAARVFLDAGLSRTNLYYLNSDPHPGGGLTPDAPATSTNLQSAIETWATDKVGPDKQLYLYLVDHGGQDTFMTNGSGDPT